jgi:hypothetical protein
MVQTQRVYRAGSPDKCFELNSLCNRMRRLGGHCSRFCSCENLTFLQLSTPADIPLLNLKGFQEGSRVDLLVPNQIPEPIESY